MYYIQKRVDHDDADAAAVRDPASVELNQLVGAVVAPELETLLQPNGNTPTVAVIVTEPADDA